MKYLPCKGDSFQYIKIPIFQMVVFHEILALQRRSFSIFFDPHNFVPLILLWHCVVSSGIDVDVPEIYNHTSCCFLSMMAATEEKLSVCPGMLKANHLWQCNAVCFINTHKKRSS
jgi:hypothetical protein